MAQIGARLSGDVSLTLKAVWAALAESTAWRSCSALGQQSSRLAAAHASRCSSSCREDPLVRSAAKPACNRTSREAGRRSWSDFGVRYAMRRRVRHGAALQLRRARAGQHDADGSA